MSKLIAKLVTSTTLLAALATVPANGQAFTTFGPLDAKGGPGGLIFSGNWEASQFLFGGLTGSTLAKIRFAGADAYAGTPASPLTVALYSGSTTSPGAAPGSILESWTVPDNTLGDQIWTLNSTLHPTLTNGLTYWLVLEVGTYAWTWDNSVLACPTTCGFATSSNSGGDWTFTASHLKPAFDIYVNAVTPEPATMSLMALGLVGMASAGIRRRKRSR